MEQVRTLLSSANASTPKGHLSDGHRTWEVGANDQIFTANDYGPLVIAQRRAVRTDVGRSRIGREHPQFRLRQRQAVGAGDHLRQPGANIIDR